MIETFLKVVDLNLFLLLFTFFSFFLSFLFLLSRKTTNQLGELTHSFLFLFKESQADSRTLSQVRRLYVTETAEQCCQTSTDERDAKIPSPKSALNTVHRLCD